MKLNEQAQEAMAPFEPFGYEQAQFILPDERMVIGVYEVADYRLTMITAFMIGDKWHVSVDVDRGRAFEVISFIARRIN